MAIFKIVDKSAVESSGCSGRRGVEIWREIWWERKRCVMR